LEQLQSYTTSRLEVILARYGKKIIGWDEILEGGVTPSATIMSWRGEKGGIEAAQIGNNVIMTPNTKGFYLDYYQGDAKVDEVCFGSKTYLADIYQYDPIPSVIREAGLERYIMGVQANLWSEYVYSDDRLDRALYPRVLALAEAGWSDPSRRDFSDFCRRMAGSLVRLELKGADYHTPLVEQVGGSFDRVAFVDSLVLDLTTSRPLPVVYTVDGSEPTLNSARYESPRTFTQSVTLKVASISESSRVGRVRSIELVKEPYRPSQKVEVDTLTSGLRFYRKEGAYLSVEELDGVKWDSISTISNLSQMTGRAFTTFDREVERFATKAVGYLNIPEDGVYLFSSENERVVVDGLTIVDNHSEVKRHSRADGSISLAKGMHPIEVYFINDYIGGIPANWMGSAVRCRKLGAQEGFKPLTDLWF
ncbi:MAG: family 20 glycosylhydrolase, partial [Rikenellaceae bacterium]